MDEKAAGPEILAAVIIGAFIIVVGAISLSTGWRPWESSPWTGATQSVGQAGESCNLACSAGDVRTFCVENYKVKSASFNEQFLLFRGDSGFDNSYDRYAAMSEPSAKEQAKINIQAEYSGKTKTLTCRQMAEKKLILQCPGVSCA